MESIIIICAYGYTWNDGVYGFSRPGFSLSSIPLFAFADYFFVYRQPFAQNRLRRANYTNKKNLPCQWFLLLVIPHFYPFH
jgi:hypothetical protein